MMETLVANVRRALDILVPQFHEHRQKSNDAIVLGISGLQGAGKSTWASLIVQVLLSEHKLTAATVSLDDFYKTHEGLIERRNNDPTNTLYRTRGPPGTHDEGLAAQFFTSLKHSAESTELGIPSFDKSKYNGEGDRVPTKDWTILNRKPDVVVFEGWCIGFQPIPTTDVERMHQLALDGKLPVNTPANHKVTHLLEVNNSLKRYCDLFMGPKYFDFMIHIDTDDLKTVYKWRLEQEHKLIQAKGSGMTDAEVVAFINGYMPSYELYLDGLRSGFFGNDKGRQLHIVLDAQRSISRVAII